MRTGKAILLSLVAVGAVAGRSVYAEDLTAETVAQVLPVAQGLVGQAQQALAQAEADARRGTEQEQQIMGIAADILNSAQQTADLAIPGTAEEPLIQAARQLEGSVKAAPVVLQQLGASKALRKRVAAMATPATQLRSLLESQTPGGIDTGYLLQMQQISAQLLDVAKTATENAQRMSNPIQPGNRMFAVAAAFGGIQKRAKELNNILQSPLFDAAQVRKAIKRVKDAREDALVSIRWAMYGDREYNRIGQLIKQLEALL